MPERPFRITYVDDDVYDSVVNQDRIQDDFGKGRVLQGLRTYAKQAGDSVQLLLGPDLEFLDGEALELRGARQTRRGWTPDVIAQTDVLLLDLAGMGRLRPALKVTAEHVQDVPELPAAPSEQEIQILNDSLSGAGFLIANRRGLLRSCQHIVLLTKYDQNQPTDEDEGTIIDRYVHPLCSDTPSGHTPWATMGNLTDRRALDRLLDQIETLHHTFADGFTRLTDRGAIELAAVHDQPVLIVGETGTGKEYVARNIHRRWAQEKFRDREFAVPGAAQDPADVPFVAINCSLLDPEIGRTELFGAVQGTYSSLERHRLGAVLRAAGLTLASDSSLDGSTASPTDFRDRLLRDNGSLLEPVGGNQSFDLALTSDERVPHLYGVLFLDELAELPGQSQSQLLRLLQSMEVSPLGYPGTIQGLNLRVLAATNDAQVAALAGHELRYDMPRPNASSLFRGDLISRLKGQVIKTTPVTEHNVEAWVHHLAESVSSVEWTDDAKAHFVDELKTQIRELKVAQSERGSGAQMPFFANRREIQQVVDRAATYVQTARQRGLRDVGERVTASIVERVWRPSSVQLPQAVHSSAGSQDAETSSEEPDAPDADRHDRKRARELYEAIRTFLRRKGHPIENWRTPETLDHVGPDEKAARAAWKELRAHVESLKSQSPSLVKALWTDVIRPRSSAAQREAAFGVHRSTVSKLFNE